MASGYTAVDLSQLSPPGIVETLSFEAIFSEMLSELQSRDPTFDALVESDPAFKILEVAAYREVIIRQRVNDGCHGVMLAYAGGADLDNLGALLGVSRLLVAAETDTDPARYEADAAFRTRIQLSLEGFSTAGPAGAYVYHTKSADADVLDASATSPAPGEVVVSVLSAQGNGSAPTELLDRVRVSLSAEDVRPLTDQVTVQSAQIVNYQITATLYFFDGPDASTVMEVSRAAAEAYAQNQHRVGRDITLSGIYAALHQPGVQRVVLATPVSNVTITDTQASYCTAITLTNGGTDV